MKYFISLLNKWPLQIVQNKFEHCGNYICQAQQKYLLHFEGRKSEWFVKISSSKDVSIIPDEFLIGTMLPFLKWRLPRKLKGGGFCIASCQAGSCTGTRWKRRGSLRPRGSIILRLPLSIMRATHWQSHATFTFACLFFPQVHLLAASYLYVLLYRKRWLHRELSLSFIIFRSCKDGIS